MVRSEVLAVDPGQRILTVVGPREEILEVRVSDEVENFDQIMVSFSKSDQ